MKSTYTIAVNEVIGLSTAETILMQFEYDQQKINDSEATLRTAIKNYLKTDAGKQQVNMNCGCFNWGDAYYIPDRFFEKYGLTKVVAPNVDLIVDHNESFTDDFSDYDEDDEECEDI